MVEYSALIIDDDIWMQRILSKTLQSYGFKTTYLASNGFEGINISVEHKPTLIIMDILMPELSGHLVLKILKNINSTKHIPVLMVSALSDTENLGLAFKSGTAGFISKPFTRATVYEKLISIFGKEKLDLIAKGEPIDNDYLDIAAELNALKDNAIIISGLEYGNNADDNSSINPVDNEVYLLKKQSSGEARSIESIKKLLQRTRQGKI